MRGGLQDSLQNKSSVLNLIAENTQLTILLHQSLFLYISLKLFSNSSTVALSVRLKWLNTLY